MITVEMKSLLNHLNEHCTSCLESAAGYCVSRTHYEITVEHLFIKLLEDNHSDLALILRFFNIDRGKLQRKIEETIEEYHTGNSSRPVFSPLLMEWLQDAWLISSIDLDENEIRSCALFLSFLKKSARFSVSNYNSLITHINSDSLLKQLDNLLSESIEKNTIKDKNNNQQVSTNKSSALSRYCVNFTEKAGLGEIDPVFGRDTEIRQIIDILSRRRKNNPIVVGEAGVGKTAVVEGLALRIIDGDVPDLLKDVSIYGLDLGLLQAGAGVKGEFEKRLKSVIDEVKESVKPIILFIDEAHMMIGAGGQAGGGDAANLLKPALARGELRTLAATTWSEYKKYFEKDAALARRFQPVKLDEPSEEISVLILRGLKEKYENAHGVIIRDDAIQAAAELSDKYISGRQLPDKAIDLLDTSAARVKVLLTAKPDIIEDKERSIQAYEREKNGLERDHIHGINIDKNKLNEISAKIVTLTNEKNDLVELWKKEKELANNVIEDRKAIYEHKSNKKDLNSVEFKEIKERLELNSEQLKKIQEKSSLIHIEVDPNIVSKIVSDWTGIPLGNIMRDEAIRVNLLEENILKRIKGQNNAIELISEEIRNAKAGIKMPEQPLGVFLLVGPSGVGKTETGLTVADLLFGGEKFMVTINMSEFQEKHTVSRLLGSPPGYVGYGEGGVLTEAVRQRPYSVVLLDEVEKAHPEVLNIFYQVFDKGMLADGEGRIIDFKNTVIFLTSNLASDVITELCKESKNISAEDVISAIRPILSNHFKPALLARMNIIPYITLSSKFMKEIVRLKINRLAERLIKRHKVKMIFTSDVIEFITKKCTESETGARNIDYIISTNIMPQMSRSILDFMSNEKMPSEISLSVEYENIKINFIEY